MAIQDVNTLQQRLQAQQGNTRANPTAFKGSYTPESDNRTSDASKIAANIMRKDSPLMRQARTEGRQATNSRGLLSSSMTSGESTDRVLKQVVPLAQQESQQRHANQLSDREAGHRLNQAEQSFGFNQALSEQDFLQTGILQQDTQEHAEGMSDREAGHRRDEAEQNFGFNQALSEQDFQQQSGLSEQEFQQASTLSEQDFEQQMGMSREEYRQALGIQRNDQRFQSRTREDDQRHERGLANRAYQNERLMQRRDLASAEQLARMDSETRETLMTMESDMRQRLAEMDVDMQTQENMGSMITSMNGQYQESINTILGNPDLSADERNDMLRAAGEFLNHQVDLIEDLYGTEVDWLSGGFDITSPTESEDDQEEDEEDEPAPTPQPTATEHPGP